MAFEERTSNLLFLLSFSPLVAGCPAGDDTSSGETTGTPMTTGSTGTPMTGDSTAAPMTTEGSGSGTSATETGPSPDTDGVPNCEGSPPMMFEGPVDPVCVAAADEYSECFYGGTASQQCLDYYQARCQYRLEYAISQYGDICGMAYIDLYSCITALTCEELETVDTQCEAEYTVLAMECSP